ncbi:MAG: hypothetical protein L6R19_24270 [Alphaproteobacteria bacterium]|nr:hypothetical protein [Alphaproteobacteria bacterium]
MIEAAGRAAAVAALYAVSTLVLLLPALWNGFPFMFYDTGAFIEQALTSKFIAERSVFYAWFIAAFQPNLSLWPVAVAQAFMTVWVMRAAMRVLNPGLGAARFLALVVVLAVATALPWTVGQILPDFLTALLVSAIYLLGFHGGRLDGATRLGLGAVAVLAATSHASHLALAAGLAVVIAAAQGLLRGRRLDTGDIPVRPRWEWPAATVALSLALLLGSNYLRAGELFFSRSGAAFAFGRLVQDGIAKRLLDDTCPQSGYRLCPYKNALKATADEWLWAPDTPFWKIGGFDGTGPEYERMIRDSLRRYPGMHLETALKATLVQFVTFRTGDGIEAQTWPTFWIMETYLPEQYAAFRAARQQNDLIDFVWLNGLHRPVGAIALLAAAGFVAWGTWRRRLDAVAVLPGFLLIALLGNAFICGVLSNPHDRYQSRLIWIVPFALVLLASRGTVSPPPRSDRSSPPCG